MIELPNFSACYEKLITGYYSTSVYQDVQLKYFNSNCLVRFRNRSMKQNCKQSAVIINDQQDKMEIPFHVKIPILIDNSFSVLKHNSYARGYHAYMYNWKPLIGNDSLFCKREDDNIHDKNAVAVIYSNHIGPRIVGHVSFLYSKFKKFLSLPNHKIRVLVTGKRMNHGAGYGFEIPVEYVFNVNKKALQWAKKNLDNIDANVNKKLEDD